MGKQGGGSRGENSLLALAGPVDYGPQKTWCVMRKFIIFLGIGLCIGCTHVENLQETVPEDLGETTAPGFEPDSAFTDPDRSVPADDAMQARLESLAERAAALREFKLNFGERPKIIF